MADLLDPLAALADDGAGQLREKPAGWVRVERLGREGFIEGGVELAYVFGDGHLRGDDRAADVAVRASAACGTMGGRRRHQSVFNCPVPEESRLPAG